MAKPTGLTRIAEPLPKLLVRAHGVVREPLAEHAAVAAIGVATAVLAEGGGVGLAVEQAVGDREGHHGVVGEAAVRLEQGEFGALDVGPLVDRADDVPGDRGDHEERILAFAARKSPPAAPSRRWGFVVGGRLLPAGVGGELERSVGLAPVPCDM
ncbi:hypothetical protein [Nannocystis pusilla]|uniref:hypothetical protein n=1 Tax=Nannocystis pusilla TaxID=889268 RepID=UPI003DA21E90